MNGKQRLLFVDLLRGWALIIMIEVHVFNAFLQQNIKDESWFSIVNFVNGLVAPSFLFVSGFAFILSINKDSQAIDNKLWRKIKRIGLIFSLGYILHIPYPTLKGIIGKATPNQLQEFIKVDILQCIAVGLLLLIFLRITISHEKLFEYTLLLISVFVIIISPLFWSINFEKFLPIFFAAYFNQKSGSLFPIFPWISFLLAGSIVCIYYLRFRQNNKENLFINYTIFLGSTSAFLSYLILHLNIFSSLSLLKPNPFFFTERLGIVMLLLSFFWKYTQLRQKDSFVTDVSRESLLVYFLHLEIIYSKILGNKSAITLYGGKLNINESIVLTIILIIAMITVAKVWSYLKKYKPDAASLIMNQLFVMAVLYFFIK
ncbi:heparan-alpha-glucosaminide N-acetyltransferase domain-containing protein [Melioribacteraceae bacterium 4301-Me]|uniref:heparan-alpha-glucosaminide N-acetyltransferase domain-containing protein n=1 Tax=Pyranulibacter aquaticus TaxID=3163344 RepID=UPI0035996E77